MLTDSDAWLGRRIPQDIDGGRANNNPVQDLCGRCKTGLQHTRAWCEVWQGEYEDTVDRTSTILGQEVAELVFEDVHVRAGYLLCIWLFLLIEELNILFNSILFYLIWFYFILSYLFYFLVVFLLNNSILGSILGLNIAFNIGFNIGVQYWVQYWV